MDRAPEERAPCGQRLAPCPIIGTPPAGIQGPEPELRQRLRCNAAQIEVEKLLGIGMESDNGVGFFTALNARIASRTDADGERLSLAQCRPDEQSHGHGIEKNRRGMAPQAIKRGEALSQRRSLVENSLAVPGAQLQH